MTASSADSNHAFLAGLGIATRSEQHGSAGLSPDPRQTSEANAQTVQKSEAELQAFQAATLAAFASVAVGLGNVEQTIRKCFTSDAPMLNEVAEYLLLLGGKRIRPIFCLLAAKLYGMTEASEELLIAASGIELIHMATLLHDDIIDQSMSRRHKPSALAKYGPTSSLLAGDFLLVKAFGLCAKLDRFVIEATETACVELTEGEILESTIDEQTIPSIEQYETVVGKKTASLFALSAAVGAHLAGADEHDVNVLRRFGYHSGIAFQMVDDILDVTAESDLLGKPSGLDLKQKTPSLINILWLMSDEPAARAFFRVPNLTLEQAQAVRDVLRTTPIIDRARRMARAHVDTARSLLASRQMTGSHDTASQETAAQLDAVLEYTLSRCL